MSALEAADVVSYSSGRIVTADAEKLLARGLRAARQFCGWHVTPEQPSGVLILDGPGGRLLRLPTLRLAEPLTLSITEDGTMLDVAALEVSRSGLVRKSSWTSKLGAIEAEMTHGFADAEDFDAAVLSWIDRASLAPTGGRPRAVGPFQYDTESISPGTAFTESERALLEHYRLERPA